MELSSYIKCPNCHTILNDPEKRVGKTPCCGTIIETREVWPSLDAHILLDIVKQQNLESYQDQKVAIVFVCTLLEMMLEKAVCTLIQSQVKTEKAIETLLDGYQGRKKRIDLFDKMSDFKMRSFIEANGYKNFFKNWSKLTSIRNSVVHKGNYGSTGISKEEINSLILSLVEEYSAVFVLIHNEVTKSKKACGN